ncbi:MULTISPECIES: AtzG-like protein [Methylobacterium]|uniref:Protein of unassigned function n=1 Tax=Methylobacterium oryzae CBMB20 TaxID=693986 RepID=A0A089NRV4_9HYPH|nr:MULTISPECIES: AtzG-like protein [Methylobacterium]AIQ88573.1 protein of unassigned function [Methylobacterium oryzae CBMB20]AWV18854.1 hypothetical protein A3862_27660 [Methylobacterium sp. XJLW]WFS08597.1 DUF4089 domain-containing protein [Methylobacterium sp. 391_Methyba4]
MPETCPPFDPESYAAVTAALLGLPLDPAWMGPITANLRVLAAAAALVEAFPLADEIDAAPRFEA